MSRVKFVQVLYSSLQASMERKVIQLFQAWNKRGSMQYPISRRTREMGFSFFLGTLAADQGLVIHHWFRLTSKNVLLTSFLCKNASMAHSFQNSLSKGSSEVESLRLLYPPWLIMIHPFGSGWGSDFGCHFSLLDLICLQFSFDLLDQFHLFRPSHYIRVWNGNFRH